MNCPPNSGVVVFNFADWVVQYPEFATLSQSQGQSFFNRVAANFLDNTACSPVQNLFQRTTLLNMAVAHFAKIFGTVNGQGPNGLVGQINSATEGSVTVGTVYTVPVTDTQAFWNQTPYGAAFWAATVQFRTGFYVPPPLSVGAAGFPFLGYFPGRRF